MRINDHQLNYWANIYRGNRIDDHGISFGSFIQSPAVILAETRALDFLPLLPAQREVMRRVPIEPVLMIRNGRAFEKRGHQRPSFQHDRQYVFTREQHGG